MEKVIQFFEFEIKNHLFDYVDKRGLRPWEAVRYQTMMSVLHKKGSHEFLTAPSYKSKIITNLVKIFDFFAYFIVHRHKSYFIYLCSRDKLKNNIYDKIADESYTFFDKTNCFVLESLNCYKDKNYRYKGYVAPSISNVFGYFQHSSYDFSYFYNLIKKEFPSSYITKEIMENSYKEFLGQYYFFRFIFKNCHIEKAFVVQNGIQKGLFAAANELNVELYEFQHGQISINHPAYSYPKESSLPASKIYHPDYLLTFGSFWSKNRSYPGVVDIVIGNNSYSTMEEISETHGNKKLIVVSNAEEGELLAKRVEEVLQKDSSFYFYFKLHSEQFTEYEYYKRRFENNERVEVISNQMSINQLLMKCEGIFLNESTVELEALRMGRKVFVLKEQYYQVMDFVLGEKGVYACDSAADFIEKYEKHKNDRIMPRNDLFTCFKEDIAKEIIRK